MKFLLFFIPFFSFSAFAESEFDSIRNLFDLAIQNESKTEELIRYLQKKAPTPLVKGYLGAATILMARHAYSPLTKLNYFNEGKVLLESSIQQDPLSPDLRYLRLIIQENVPWFLYYSNNLKEDKLYLQNYLEINSDSDASLRLRIKHALNIKEQNAFVKD